MRLMRLLSLLVLAAWPLAAQAQSTPLQGGPWIPGHLLQYANPGSGQPVVVDGGNAGGGPFGANPNELGLTALGQGAPPYANAGGGPNGENFCDYDAPTTSANGYHVLCLSPNADGGGLLSFNAYGGASALPLLFQLNGITSSVVLGPGASTNGHLACWTGTTGSVLADCGTATGGTVTSVATGAGLTGGPITGAGTVSIANSITPGGPIGSATTVPVITYNAQGELTAVTSANISGIAPGGAASGDLSGTYPGPTVAKVNGVTYGAGPSTNTVPVVSGSNAVTYEAVPNAALANAATTVNAQTCTLGSTCTVTVPISTGVSGLAAGIATWLATPSSANLAAALTDETGTGVTVFATSPTLVTPTLGAATATSVNKVAITAPATSATLTIPNGVTFTGPAASGTAMTLGNAETVAGAKSFTSGDLLLKGATSGTITLNAAATAGSSTITLPAGTTDFSGTGGANQVVKQSTSGGAFTVGTLATTNLSDVSSGSWTPTDASGAGLTFTGSTSAAYTKIGNMIFAYAQINFPSTANTASAAIGGLPFSFPASGYSRQCTLNYSNQASSAAAFLLPNVSTATFGLQASTGAAVTNVTMSTSTIEIECVYPAS